MRFPDAGPREPPHTGEESGLPGALLNPLAWPEPPPRVDLIETHVSWVFLGGRHAYKVKKPVDLGFLDFRRLSTRRHFCREEVRLNRRLTRHTYLGVVPIVPAGGGALRIGGPEEQAVEYAVHMRRLPADRMLGFLLETCAVHKRMLEDVAVCLARFHARAATGEGVDIHGSPRTIAFNALENFEQIRPFTAECGAVAPAEPQVITPRIHHWLESHTRDDLRRLKPVFVERVRSGRIRDGHGDLHTGNICFAPWELVIYDCIEFAPRFRCGDVANDLAFLVMDLEYRGHRAAAEHLLRTYVEEAGDPGLLEPLPFYKAYRAMVRAKVAAMLAGELAPEDRRRERARADAVRHVHLAAAYGIGRILVLMCGLPGCGKSVTAREIAAPFDARVLRSDVVRKRLAGLSPETHAPAPFGRGIYAGRMSDATYAELLRAARAAIREGRSVVVDASFPTRARRAPFLELAREFRIPAACVFLEVPDRVARRRITSRRRHGRDPSDADVHVLDRARASFEPPTTDVPADMLVIADGRRPPLDTVTLTLESLLAQS